MNDETRTQQVSDLSMVIQSGSNPVCFPNSKRPVLSISYILLKKKNHLVATAAMAKLPSPKNFAL